MAEIAGGWNFDLFDTTDPGEVLARVKERAQGWDPSYVQLERGIVFPFPATFRVYGRATGTIAASAVQQQTADAVNSFWTIGGVEVNVYASQSLTIPASAGNAWAGALQWAAIAAAVLGIGWVLYQARKIAS